MPELFLHALSLADAGDETLPVTRERLKERFPKGATRRMTQLGLLVGAALDEAGLRPGDALVYASGYAETCALESFLDSFPTPSPTLFQTSIHPSAVQQALIARQHPVDEFFPLTGRGQLVAHAMQAVLLAKAGRVLLCGGEERGTWLLAQRAASDLTFAFALALSREPAGAIARVTLAPTADSSAPEFTLPEFFDALLARRSIDQIVAPGLRLGLAWHGP